jgi:multidrug efflux pump subunit AcrA (membrane-fusion protein)
MLAMAEDRPRFRRDLVAKPIEAEGVQYVEVSDPRTGARFHFYDFEHRVAEALDGRPLSEVLPALRDASGIELTAEQLVAFVQQLEELGFTEPRGDTTHSGPLKLPGNGVSRDTEMAGAIPAPGRHDQPTAELDTEPPFEPDSALSLDRDSDQLLREPMALPDFASPALPDSAAAFPEFAAPPPVVMPPPSALPPMPILPPPAPPGDRVITSELDAFREALLSPEIDAAIEAATSHPAMPAYTPSGAIPVEPAEEVDSDTLEGLAPAMEERPSAQGERASAKGELQAKPFVNHPPDRVDPLETAITPLRIPSFPLPFTTTPPAPRPAPPPSPRAATPPRPMLVPTPEAPAEAPAPETPSPTPVRPVTVSVMAGLAILAAGAIGFFVYRLSTTTDPAPVPVRTVLPTLGSVYRFFDAVGTVKSSGERTLAFPTGGKVAHVMAAGSAFHPGDLLGELDGARKSKNDLSHHRERLAYYEQMLETMRGAGNKGEARQAELKIMEKKRLVSEAQAKLSRVAIVSTGAGEIAEAMVAAGATVKPGAPAIRIKGSDWRAELELSREEADRLRHLGFCRAEIDGKPLDCSLSADGGDETHVSVDLPSDPAMAAGRPVRVAKARFDGVFVLPASALAPTKGADRRVYVVKDGHVESYAVVLADQNASEIVVKQGLEPESPVVVDVPANLRPRAAVRVLK